MEYTYEGINDATGFADGDTFSSPERVRAYFSRDNMERMFGDHAGMRQDDLDAMAATMLVAGWHCSLDMIIDGIAAHLDGESLNYWHQQPRDLQVEVAVEVQRGDRTLEEAAELVRRWGCEVEAIDED